MGICRLCGESAGFLRSVHGECKHAHDQAVTSIHGVVAAAFESQDHLTGLRNEVAKLAGNGFVSEAELHAILVQCWSVAVDHRLEKGLLSVEDEQRITELDRALALPRVELEKTAAWGRVVRSGVIRDIMNGIVPQRDCVNPSSLPINFQKLEKLVWSFPSTGYFVEKTRREYVGGSHGVSVRIAKGVYWHTSSFRGHPVDHEVLTHADNGWFVVTDKNLYFAGPHKSLRLPFSKIVSFQPFDKGIGLIRNGVNAHRELFVNAEGWFSYNMIVNLAKL